MTINRNRYVDVLRGMAIILVVFGHAIQGANHGDSSNSVHLVIQSFQMALLMIISGYVIGLSEIEGNYKSAIEKRVRRLLIPYIVWEQIHYFLKLIKEHKSYSIGEHIGGVLWSDFWFLRVLFFLCLFYILYVYLACRFGIHSKSYGGGYRQILILAGMYILVFVISYIKGFENLRLYSIFFAIGNVIFRIRQKRLLDERKKGVLAVINIILFAVMITVFFSTIPSVVKWGVFKLMGIVGSIVFATLAFLVKKYIKQIRFIEWAGRNSLAIYAIHWCLLFSLDIPPLWNYAGTMPFYLVALAGCIVWIMICCIVIQLLKKNRITRQLLLGE